MMASQITRGTGLVRLTDNTFLLLAAACRSREKSTFNGSLKELVPLVRKALSMVIPEWIAQIEHLNEPSMVATAIELSGEAAEGHNWPLDIYFTMLSLVIPKDGRSARKLALTAESVLSSIEDDGERRSEVYLSNVFNLQMLRRASHITPPTIGTRLEELRNSVLALPRSTQRTRLLLLITREQIALAKKMQNQALVSRLTSLFNELIGEEPLPRVLLALGR